MFTRFITLERLGYFKIAQVCNNISGVVDERCDAPNVYRSRATTILQSHRYIKRGVKQFLKPKFATMVQSSLNIRARESGAGAATIYGQY